MMRINLSSLAPTKTKPGGRRLAPTPTGTISVRGEGPRTAVLMLAFVLVVGGGIAGTDWWAAHERTRLQADLAKALAENRRLSGMKARYDAQKTKSDRFERRLEVIHKLQREQNGPAELLNFVADTVNRTGAVWLESMNDDGTSLDFQGMALSTDAVADLMANLRNTGRFKSVEIKETSQDPQVKKLQAFRFELICEKAHTGKIQQKV